MIEFECSKCSAPMSAATDRLGQMELCPSCGKMVTAPRTATVIPDIPPLTPDRPKKAWTPRPGAAHAVGGVVMMILGAMLIYGKNQPTAASVFVLGGVLLIGVASVVNQLSQLRVLISKQSKKEKGQN